MSEIKLEESWKAVLGGEFTKPHMQELKQFLRQEYGAGRVIYPKGNEYFAAMDLTPFDEAAWEKVLAEVNFFGDEGGLSGVDMTGYETYAYVHSVESYSGAKAYYLDASKRYVLVASFSISAAE